MKCHDSVGFFAKTGQTENARHRLETSNALARSPLPEEQTGSNPLAESSLVRFAPLKASRFRFFESGMDQVVP